MVHSIYAHQPGFLAETDTFFLTTKKGSEGDYIFGFLNNNPLGKLRKRLDGKKQTASPSD